MRHGNPSTVSQDVVNVLCYGCGCTPIEFPSKMGIEVMLELACCLRKIRTSGARNLRLEYVA